MALITCPSCSTLTSDSASTCDHCGKSLRPRGEAPITKLSGKFTVVGVVIIAIAVIGTALGTWWGPAALLPGVALYMMAKFL